MADLTTRQRQVLDRLARGRTHKEIARDLDLSVNTVQDHVSGLLRALGAHTPAHAVDIAHQRGIFDSPPPPIPKRHWDNADVIARRRRVLLGIEEEQR